MPRDLGAALLRRDGRWLHSRRPRQLGRGHRNRGHADQLLRPAGGRCDQRHARRRALDLSALNQAAETMRRGGGVGYDFSPIRPKRRASQGHAFARQRADLLHARVRQELRDARIGRRRRGAQMGMMRCDHPDIEDFINAKRDGSLVELQHERRGDRRLHARGRKQRGDRAVACRRTVRQVDRAAAPRRHVDVPARRGRATLFDQIMKSTYNHAEPGVIFIDRVNQDNNLSYSRRSARPIRAANSRCRPTAAAASARST